MAVEITMPPLSQTTDSVRLVKWLVNEGDAVKKGDPLCEVETDKVTMEVESYTNGTVLSTSAPEGEDVKVGTVIAYVGDKGEAVPAQDAGAEEGAAASAPSERVAAEQAPAKKESATAVSPLARKIAERLGVDLSALTGSGPGGRVTREDVEKAAEGRGQQASSAGQAAGGNGNAGVKVSRMVRYKAEKMGIDLSNVPGSGAGSLITREDLLAFAEGGGRTAAAGTVRPAAAAGAERPAVAIQQAPAGAGLPSFHEEPLSANQSAVAANLSRSMREIPHYTVRVTVDAAPMTAFRQSKPLPDGRKISVYSPYIFAVSRALARHAGVNGSYRDGKRLRYGAVNVAFAYAVGSELFAPVVKDADKKPIHEIDADLKWLAAKAQNGKLEAGDINGATFTLSNLGSFPIDEFTAVISPGHGGIIAIGRSGPRVYADKDGAIRTANTAVLNGSFDHRIINGAQAAEFLTTVRRILEEELG
jgi:pyruvate dehydrogenase E2 component (dihydrolipoamide acetyltransferase)